MAQQPGIRPVPRRARKSFSALTSDRDAAKSQGRRASAAGGAALTAGGAKAQRTSKTQQRLVVLPSAPQTKPLPKALSDDEDGEADDDEDRVLGYETDAGQIRSMKSAGERWSKTQRENRGCKRMTAYSVANALKSKALAGFLRREHNVVPRVFDEAIYAVYHFPLLPGYGPGVTVRSSAPERSHSKHIHTALDAAEAAGYQGTYFAPAEQEAPPPLDQDGFIPSSPNQTRLSASQTAQSLPTDIETDAEGEGDARVGTATDAGAETDAETIHRPDAGHVIRAFLEPPTPTPAAPVENVGEVVFFDYGVVVFFGFDSSQERSILEDIGTAGFASGPLSEDDWEVEECHFEHNPSVAHPRIYNDYFTLKSSSHLLKLSIAHAMAQSTLLARYEASAVRTLSAQRTTAIPRQLALSGALKLKRREALKLTGALFALRRDVNLLGHVLDVPELFWSEASLKDLYDAVREYMEIDHRVQVLNEKLAVASDLLDAIHDHLNNSAMERITVIIIWLIVIACLVEMGEVVARLVVHATQSRAKQALMSSMASSVPQAPLDRQSVLMVLDRMTGAATK